MSRSRFMNKYRLLDKKGLKHETARDYRRLAREALRLILTCPESWYDFCFTPYKRCADPWCYD